LSAHGKNSAPTSYSGANTDPFVQKQRHIRSQLKSLLDDNSIKRGPISSQLFLNFSETTIAFSVALKFKQLIDDLMLIPERKIARETVDMFLKVMVHYDNFFNTTIVIDEAESTLESNSGVSVRGIDSNLQFDKFVEVENVLFAYLIFFLTPFKSFL
jgi:hypothetical protein